MTRTSARRWVLIAAAAVLIGVAAYGSSPWVWFSPDDRREMPVVFATGSPGGVDYAYGQALAAAVSGELGPAYGLATAGAVENLELLGRGRVTFAFATADTVEAYSSQTPPTGATSVRAVARLYDNYTHLIVQAELPVHTVADLRGMRVSVGSPGSDTAFVADRILRAAGLDPRGDLQRVDLSLTDAVSAMRDRRIDAFFLSGGLATPEVLDLAGQAAIRLTDLADIAATLRSTYGSYYQTGTVPAGTYQGMTGSITTLVVPNLLLTAEGTPDPVVERMTGVLFASATRIADSIPAVGQIDRHAAIFTGAIPLHDGARAYYRSTKVAR
ncbi:TAXI family TRAP transporter solute-binding subunit [Dactylosporangium sp. NPDC005572]|uniref:TAXI family TRAP transporter solute-binding subunit n=1 Tax=Dactylosporangium sp. NPDC005572 TaxID=3156889 RepID=UPI00339EB4AF